MAGWTCDGFAPPPSKAPRKFISHRPLRSNGNSELSLLLEPSSARFQSQKEHHFFQVFRTITAPHLSGYLDPELWNRIVLQVSEQEESIRHAVISIGVLDMAKVPSPTREKHQTNEALQRNLFALKQYNLAIKALRQKVFTHQDLRTALVASILIICFETFHRNWETVAAQLKTTIRLIESRRRELGSNKDVEEDLLCMFNRLDMQTMSRTDPQIDLFTMDERLAFKDSQELHHNSVPDRFDEIPTARNYLYEMLRRQAHFTYWVRKKQAMDITGSPETPPASYLSHAQSQADEALLLERSKHLREAARWMEAFGPLYEKHRTPEQRSGDRRSFLAVSLMRLHFLIMVLTRVHMFDTSEVGFDRSFSSFKEMVDLCEDLLSDRNKFRGALGGAESKTFVFELQTLMALDNVAKKCRDPSIRRRAIGLLIGTPMREGVRDSVLCGKSNEWVMKIEEEGMVDGFIGEKKRTKDVSVISVDSTARRAIVRCWVGGLDGERREGVVEW